MTSGATTRLVLAVALAGCASPSAPGPSPAPSPPHLAASIAPTASAGVTPPDPERDPDGCRPRLRTPEALTRPGPAYVLDPGDAVLRIEASGITSVAIETAGVTRLHPGVDQEVWLSNADGLHVLEPTSSAPRRVAPPVPGRWLHLVAVRSPREIWATAIEGEIASRKSSQLVRFDGTRWTAVDGERFRDPEVSSSRSDLGLPIALVFTAGNSWLATTSGVFQRADGADWKRLDTGWPDRMFAMPDRVVMVMNRHRVITEMRDEAWGQLPLASGWGNGEGEGEGEVVALGASGLAVRRVHDRMWIASVDGDCGPREIQGLRGRVVEHVAVDGRHRVWIATRHGLLVVDRMGEILAEYAPWSLPGLRDHVSTVVVPSAGPEKLPVATRAARRIHVVGYLRASKYASLIGATVRIRTSTDIQRIATSDAMGAFRLDDVPDGLHWVDVTEEGASRGCPPGHMSRGFDLSTASACPDTPSGGTCDLGELPSCLRTVP